MIDHHVSIGMAGPLSLSFSHTSKTIALIIVTKQLCCVAVLLVKAVNARCSPAYHNGPSVASQVGMSITMHGGLGWMINITPGHRKYSIQFGLYCPESPVQSQRTQ